MQKRILFISLGVATTALFIFGAYYVAVFLPQKQKESIEKVKLELEAKMEKEKLELLKINQEKQVLEDEKQQKADEERQQAEEAALKEAQLKKQQQTATSAALKKCLDDADAEYKKRLEGLDELVDKYGVSNTISTQLLVLQNRRINSRNECYK